MTMRATLIVLAGALLAPNALAQAPHLDFLGDPLPDGAIARIGTTRLKHTPGRGSAVQRTMFAPDGTKIVSIDSGGTLRLWDVTSGKELPGPWSDAKERLTAVAFSSDGLLLAAARNSGPVQMFNVAVKRATRPGEIDLYDIAHGQIVKTILGLKHYARALVFAEGGKTLVSAGEGTVFWWDIDSAKEKRAWKAFPNETQTVENGTKTKTFFECVLGPGGKSIALQALWQFTFNQPMAQRFDQYEEHEVLGFDLTSCKTCWRIAATGQRGDIARLAFSGDGKRIAVGLEQTKVEVRDVVTGKLVTAQLDAQTSGRFGGLALSQDGSRLAFLSEAAQVMVWTLDDPAPPIKFAARKSRYLTASMQRMQFSPDDSTLLVAMGPDLQLYDVGSQRPLHRWEGHHVSIDSVTFSPDGKRLVTASGVYDSRSEESLSWDAASWRGLPAASDARQRWPNLVVASPDQTVYVGKSEDGRLGLYNMTSGKLMARFVIPNPQPANARAFFSPSGKILVLDSQDSARGGDVARLYAIPSGKVLCQLPALERNVRGTNGLPPIAFASDERLVAVLGEADNMIHICETATGKVRHRLGKESPRDERRFFFGGADARLSFSPDGKLLASMNPVINQEIQSIDSSIHIWDVATGKEFARIEVDGLNPAYGPIRTGDTQIPFAWSLDNRILAVGQSKIRLWEMATRQVRRELPGHLDANTRALAYSPNGRVLASGSADTTVLIWDMVDRERPASAPRGSGEMARRWQALAGDDAVMAYASIRDLIAASDESVAWISAHAKPAKEISAKYIEELIGQLDNEQFKVRQKAGADLARLGERAVPAFDKALSGTPTLETSLRLQDLRKRATDIILKGERLQIYRGIEVLERIGTPKAREALQALAGGADVAQATVQARAALARLGND